MAAPRLLLATSILALLGLAACGSNTEQRAASGALGGAAAGAVVGGPVGAVIGGAAGATGGAVLDEGVDDKAVRAKEQISNGEPGAAATPAPGTPDPTAPRPEAQP